MYHESIFSTKKPIPAPNVELHTGLYQFHYGGGLLTGNVIRIGESSVTIKTLTIGIIEMPKAEFINSNFVKI